MRICYVQEENSLWGGVKIVFEQAEALQERGHQVIILAKDGPPDWYEVRVPLRQVAAFTPSTIPESDFVIGTFWTTVRDVVRAEKGCPVHLFQGYEGDMAVYAPQRQAIETIYSLPILTLTVHDPLTRFLWERFSKKAWTVGQGINQEVFRPQGERQGGPLWRVLVVGPYEVEWKGVRDSLIALKALKNEIPLRVVRVAQLPQTTEEAQLEVVDEYHYRLRAEAMAELYRSCDVFLGASWTQEGFGLPAIEAMACGVPVALSNIPAFRGFAKETDWAVFFAERDTCGAQDAVRRLLLDGHLRSTLRARGLAVARAFSFPQVAVRIERALVGGGVV